VRTLLGDLVHAAGGVEYHARRVVAALDRSQSAYDALVAEHPDLARGPEAVRRAVATEESLVWEYPDLLTWLRSVEERIERGVPGRRVRVGLLPAIGEDQLRVDVERASEAFRRRVGEERDLANYGLHAARGGRLRGRWQIRLAR
jgi:hypothetical protein